MSASVRVLAGLGMAFVLVQVGTGWPLVGVHLLIDFGVVLAVIQAGAARPARTRALDALDALACVLLAGALSVSTLLVSPFPSWIGTQDRRRFLASVGALLLACAAAEVLRRLERAPQLEEGSGTSEAPGIDPIGAPIAEFGRIHD